MHYTAYFVGSAYSEESSDSNYAISSISMVNDLAQAFVQAFALVARLDPPLTGFVGFSLKASLTAAALPALRGLRT